MIDRIIPSIVIGFVAFYIGAMVGANLCPVTYVTKYKTKYETKYIYAEEQQVATEYKSLGLFEVTAYCNENHTHICNDGNAKVTATGTIPTVGRTIAADPNVIPYDTKVIINGKEYIVEDTGGAIKGNKIDILFDTHDEALQFGRKTLEVFVSE